MLQRLTKKNYESVRYSHFKSVWVERVVRSSALLLPRKVATTAHTRKERPKEWLLHHFQKVNFFMDNSCVTSKTLQKETDLKALISEPFAPIVNYSLLPSCTVETLFVAIIPKLLKLSSFKVSNIFLPSCSAASKILETFPNHFQSPGNFFADCFQSPACRKIQVPDMPSTCKPFLLLLCVKHTHKICIVKWWDV